MPRAASASSSAGLKWRPAVGAATAPACAREDRLIALGIDRQRPVGAPDVGRQRQLAVPRQQGVDVGGPADHHRIPARRETFLHRRVRALRQRDAHARAQPARRPPEAFPGAARPLAHQQQLDRAAGVDAAEEPRRAHPRVVEDEQVAGCQQLRQVGDRAVGDRAVPLRQHQQAGAIAPLRRSLGDQRRRQIVVECRQRQ